MADIKENVLNFILECKTDKEIAENTGYSVANIKRIVREIFKKYKVKKRSELIVKVLKNGA